MTRMRSLTSRAQMAEDFAKIPFAVGQTLLGFLAIATQSAHDYGEFQLSAGRFAKNAGFIRIDSENFAQDLHSALLQLLVRHADVDHPVAISHAETNHGGRADHIQDKFL